MSYRRGYCSEDVIFFSTACMDEIVQGLHTASRAPIVVSAVSIPNPSAMSELHRLKVSDGFAAVYSSTWHM